MQEGVGKLKWRPWISACYALWRQAPCLFILPVLPILSGKSFLMTDITALYVYPLDAAWQNEWKDMPLPILALSVRLQSSVHLLKSRPKLAALTVININSVRSSRLTSWLYILTWQATWHCWIHLRVSFPPFVLLVQELPGPILWRTYWTLPWFHSEHCHFDQ